MEQLANYKRAYYGYFLTFIRVDLYNKILLNLFLNTNKKLDYSFVNMENNLKNQLEKDEYKSYFYKYFNIRVSLYNKFFEEYEYDIDETIDLIYEYRNFLLDDSSRIDDSKFKYITHKSLAEKERDIQKIILLLLSEYLLETFSKTFNQSNLIYEYEKSYFSQDEDVIFYRKYVSKYFGFTNHTNKMVFLNRYINNTDISYAKRYQLLIKMYNDLDINFNSEKNFLIDLDIKVTKDYLKENSGLLEIEVEEYLGKNLLLNFNQLFLIYLLKKRNPKYDFNHLLKFLKNKTNKREVNNKYVLTTNMIYEYSYGYIDNILKNRKIRRLFFKKNLKNSNNLIKLIYAKKLFNKDVRNIKQYINNKKFIYEFLCLEIVEGTWDSRGVKKTVQKYLHKECENNSKYKDEIYGIMNQISFTVNLNELEKTSLIQMGFLDIEKDYKINKKYLAKDYIDTMLILIALKVHKYNKDKKYIDAYIYRNNIMHFQKNLSYKKEDKDKILEQLADLSKKHISSNIDIGFNNRFFSLLYYVGEPEEFKQENIELLV